MGFFLALGACSSPPMLLKTTVTGGDAYPKVKLDSSGQPDLSGMNYGDTVVFAPGSINAVVASPAVNIQLVESAGDTRAGLEKGAPPGTASGAARIEVLKGRLVKGDKFVQDISINLHSSELDRYDIALQMLVFNRGDKPFSGDLAIYDLLPPELSFRGADPAVKYNDHRARKDIMSDIPLVSLVAMGMDNYSRTSETVDMKHESLGEIHKYTFPGLVLDPGQAVGFTLNLRYVPPSAKELFGLRQAARPMPAPAD